jgi:hypothetical protein
VNKATAGSCPSSDVGTRCRPRQRLLPPPHTHTHHSPRTRPRNVSSSSISITSSAALLPLFFPGRATPCAPRLHLSPRPWRINHRTPAISSPPLASGDPPRESRKRGRQKTRVSFTARLRQSRAPGGTGAKDRFVRGLRALPPCEA